MPPGQAVVEGHHAADLVESALERALPGSDVVVHVEPRRQGLDLRDRVLAIALSEPLVKEAHDITIFEQDGVGERLAAPEVPGRARPARARTRSPSASSGDPRAAGRQRRADPPRAARASARRASRADDGSGQRTDGRSSSSCVSGPAPIQQRVRLLATDAGRVLFLTLARRRGGVARPTRTASQASSRRSCASASQGIADVVVHTEPGEA